MDWSFRIFWTRSSFINAPENFTLNKVKSPKVNSFQAIYCSNTGPVLEKLLKPVHLDNFLPQFYYFIYFKYFIYKFFIFIRFFIFKIQTLSFKSFKIKSAVSMILFDKIFIFYVYFVFKAY